MNAPNMPARTNWAIRIISMGLVLMFIYLIAAFVWVLLHEQASGEQQKQLPTLTNKSCSAFQTHIISLPKRHETHLKRLMNLLPESFHAQPFSAIDGRTLDWKPNGTLYKQMTKRYWDFFERNRKEREANKTDQDYRGHLGATLSHLSVIQQFSIDSQKLPPHEALLILEDDVEPAKDFQSDLTRILSLLPPTWEVLLLGFCCQYKDSEHCRLYDAIPIHNGFIQVPFWFGGWAYMIRNVQVAQKIHQAFTPLDDHIDLGMAEMARQGQLNVFGCVPSLMCHPGRLQISGLDYTQVGDIRYYKSDTNLAN